MGITDTARWKVIYNDGTTLSEMDPDGGKQHLFKEINFKKIEEFQLVNDKNVTICQVKLNKDKRLIFARRNLITTGQLFQTKGGVKIPIPTKSHQRIIILGWQKTVNGVNTKAIFYLLPDGRIEMDDEWREDSLHIAVNTPGLIKEEPKSTKSTKIVDIRSNFGSKEEPKAKSYSTSNDSAFKNKS